CFRSRRTADFLGRTYYRQHFFWLAVKDGDDVRFLRDGVACQIKRGPKVLGEDVDWLMLRNAVVPDSPRAPDEETQRLREYVVARRDAYRAGLVFMDKEDRAEDNAEHLYRYLLATGRAGNAWFVLSSSSPDWPRLEAEGFKLLAFMSDEHIAAQMNADLLVSSHAHHAILWPVARSDFADIARYRFVFLQHGVIQNDLSQLLNLKPIRGFVTSTPDEYHDIVRHDGNYVFSEREVFLCGLPRHDVRWLRGQNQKGDSIVVMPTWRKFLVDESGKNGVAREKIDHFRDSEYSRNWHEFLGSPRLRSISREHGLRIVFAPHPNLAMYNEDMNLPDYVEVANMLEGASYQELFERARLAVTCFSSAATEVAFLDRPVVYFQFDADAFFGGEHTIKRGYFSFEDNGFGPVAHTAEDALEYVDRALRGEENPIYSKRLSP
ncbi:MAG: CDP-glycerol glycerophosphotransferase family protein, partial [Cypionkella sp.]|nr:CDP-glycerol glycerophosphotransferase family protein [Cypionkella sp.]